MVYKHPLSLSGIVLSMIRPSRRSLLSLGACHNIVIIILLLFLPSLAISGERVLTLNEAYDLSLKRLEVVKIARETLYQFEQNKRKALSTILPSLTFDVNYTKYSEVKGSEAFFVIQPDIRYNYSVRLSQSIYQGGREWSALRQAGYLIEANRRDLLNIKENTIMDVAQVYYGVIKAEREIEIREADLKRAEERLKVASARFKVGEVTKAVLLREEAEVARIKAELTKARRDLAVVKDRLARIVGIEEKFKLVLPDPVEPPPGEVEGLLKIALKNRNDYLKALAEERVAREGIRYARGGFLPTLRLEGVYIRFDQDPVASAFFNDESIYATLILSIPLYQGGLRIAEIREAKSKLQVAVLNRKNIRKNIELEIKDSVYTIQAIKSSLEFYRKQVSFAEENYKMVFKQFTYGLATNADVIDANATLVAAQESLMMSEIDLQLAILELKRRMGILLTEVTELLS